MQCSDGSGLKNQEILTGGHQHPISQLRQFWGSCTSTVRLIDSNLNGSSWCDNYIAGNTYSHSKLEEKDIATHESIAPTISLALKQISNISRSFRQDDRIKQIYRLVFTISKKFNFFDRGHSSHSRLDVTF